MFLRRVLSRAGRLLGRPFDLVTIFRSSCRSPAVRLSLTRSRPFDTSQRAIAQVLSQGTRLAKEIGEGITLSSPLWREATTARPPLRGLAVRPRRFPAIDPD